MGKNILIVDDDAMNLKLAEFILQKGSHQTTTADSGKAALELLEQQTFDLVLLDIEMPGMSGVETLHAIREKLQAKDLPVMFLSASEQEEVEQEVKSMSVSGYIHKPFKPQELLEAVADEKER